VLVFERDLEAAGRGGGVAHFGFRLRRPEDIAAALSAIEIWYELPTPVDPPEA